MNNVFTSSPVIGPPYQLRSVTPLSIFFIRSSRPLDELVRDLIRLIIPQPCAAALRVYGLDAPDHIFRADSPEPVIKWLDDCEAVALFHSDKFSLDQSTIARNLNDPERQDDDEAIVIQTVYPCPVIFLHADHNDVDLVVPNDLARQLTSTLTASGYLPRRG